jgi:hypothetical protein
METINFSKDLQFYSKPDPSINEVVLVKFTAMHDGFFDAVLQEYKDYTGIMNFKDATKKRRIFNWGKIVPLNRNMVAYAENINTNKKTVELSIAYIEEGEDMKKKLMKPFLENKILERFIKSLCVVNKLDFSEIWVKVVHMIDNDRMEEDEEKSLWEYFTENIDDIIDNINNTDDLLGTMIRTLYEKRMDESYHKITTKIGIISPGGIVHTKKLLETCLNKIEFNYTFKYEATPNYILESSSEDSSEEDHKKFIKILEIESQKSNPKVFVKV